MRIAVTGYYGHQNTGDDALAATIVAGISKQMPEAEFYLPSNPLVMPPGVRVQWRPQHPLRIRGVARFIDRWRKIRCQRLILGGGSVIHDQFGPDRLKARLRDFRLLRRLGRSLGAMGITLGPLTTEQGRVTAQKILQLFDFVAVRDRLSLTLAEEIGVLRPVLGFDPAVLLESSHLPEVSDDPYIHLDADTPVFGISVCNFHQYVGQGREADERRLAKLMDALRQVKWDGFQLWLFEFNGNLRVGDRPLAEKLASALRDRMSCRIIPYHPNPLVTLQRMKRCRGMLAMRLHAAVFAYTVQIPLLILSYHPKCLGFAEMAGVPAHAVLDSEAFAAHDLAELMHRLLRDGTAFKPSLPVEQAQALAEQNYRWFEVREACGR
jgi:polysaccharide pyruvyl transferase WcaK-like protein